MEKLRAAVKLANADWRDLLVAAGFADSVDAHKHWTLRQRLRLALNRLVRTDRSISAIEIIHQLRPRVNIDKSLSELTRSPRGVPSLREPLA